MPKQSHSDLPCVDLGSDFLEKKFFNDILTNLEKINIEQQ